VLPIDEPVNTFTIDRLVARRVIIAAPLQVKGGSFRDLPLTRELSDSLEDGSLSWKALKACGCGRGGGSQLRVRPYGFSCQCGARTTFLEAELHRTSRGFTNWPGRWGAGALLSTTSNPAPSKLI
jgi:hypothetical protein